MATLAGDNVVVSAAPSQTPPVGSSSLPRKTKYAVYFGYVGKAYSGLQHNFDPSHPTVEAKLLDAFHAARLITDENIIGNVFEKISWQRASRTDKGVSAMRNIVSVKLATPQDGEDAAVARVNAALPSDIRVYYMHPVTGSFDAYHFCTGRQYYYLLPSFCLCSPAAFDQALMPLDQPYCGANLFDNAPDRHRYQQQRNPPDPQKTLTTSTSEETKDDVAPATIVGEKRPRRDGGKKGGGGRHGHVEDGEEATDDMEPTEGAQQQATLLFDIPPLPLSIVEALYAYRLPADQLALARTLFKLYEGTKSFHNFTPKGVSSDLSTRRYIRSVTVSDPFCVTCPRASPLAAAAPATDPTQREIDNARAAMVDVEFVRVRLDGQSFMLNQIRRMVGSVVAAIVTQVARPGPPPSASGGIVTELDLAKAAKAWSPERVIEALLRTDVHCNSPMVPANGLFLVGLDFIKYSYSLKNMCTAGQLAVLGPTATRHCIKLSEEDVSLLRLSAKEIEVFFDTGGSDAAGRGTPHHPTTAEENGGASSSYALVDEPAFVRMPAAWTAERDAQYVQLLLGMQRAIDVSLGSVEAEGSITPRWLQTLRALVHQCWGAGRGYPLDRFVA